ncbi:hypothetical protein LSH36_16g06021 [Paralvinella palmiformis]|uniref:Calponin-homology (CH) domain-containing protein n=1 Tax=Paralvinella palmiformis TaxID=53620 RepID=A0AAD9NH89_9ANNE|nr:hypothetical protein LSH36_16g06021 [Paralvinella palmiformis]
MPTPGFEHGGSDLWSSTLPLDHRGAPHFLQIVYKHCILKSKHTHGVVSLFDCSKLQTFNVDGPKHTAEELTDGVAMSQVLHQIAPKFFNETWMSKIKADIGSNWRLKVNNLKKIIKGVLDYYADELGQQIYDFHMPDITAIGEHTDLDEMGRLLQLILGCAVNCDNKQLYIQRIMALEEAVQHVVMAAIQELMTKEMPQASVKEADVNEQMKKMLDELNSAIEQKEDIAQKCHELDLQVAALQEEKASLLSEVDRLNERLMQADNLEDPSTPAGRRFQQLQTQVEQQQEELYRLESARDDLKIRVDIQEKELCELQQKNDSLGKLAEEARHMKDELDILRHTSDKVVKYEQSIETYKKKLEELSDLKGQLKILEEKNTAYMQTNMDLEEEVRKAQAYKSQLEMYKRQVQEYQIKAAEETKRADKAEFESKRHQEKLISIQKEKERLVEERDSLREMNEELQCSQPRQDSVFNDQDFEGSSDLALLALPPEIKERMLRLQHENKLLKLQRSSTTQEETELIQTQLEDTKARNSELESELRILNQKILTLEAHIEDLQESQANTPTTNSASGSEMRQTVTQLRAKIESLDLELNKKNRTIEELEIKLGDKKQTAKQLSVQLNIKEDEMKEMEERYRKYLDKARSVIKLLEQPQNSPSQVDITTLKSQLHEKDRLIEHLEKDHDKTKAIRDQEERLIVSAWYNLGMLVNRKAMDERLSNGAMGQSFLARQRQVHTRRNQSITSPHGVSCNKSQHI